MKYVWTGAALAVGAYLAYCAMLFFTQNSLVFPGKATDPAQIAQLRKYYKDFGDFEVRVPGALLRGYLLLRPSAQGGARALLYFGGNADEAGEFFLWSPQALPTWSIASVNYRGYGESTGEPSEEAVIEDALATYDALKEKLGPGARLALMGRSLGSGVAVRVAARRDPAALILVTPYDSLTSVGAQKYPFVPVRLLMRQNFDVLEDAPKVTAPTLFIVAEKDGLVRPERAEALAAAWTGPRDYRVLPGGHNSVSDGPLYWQVVAAFLSQVR